MTRCLPRRSATLHALALVALFRCPAAAAFPGQLAPLTAPPGNEVNVVIKSQHRRLVFTQNVQRLAVGDSEILSAELITSREVLLLGRDIGRTTLIIWFANGSSREYLFSVQRDLSVLERALKLVNPSIEVESAPDRDALILTGIVPDVLTKQKAEAIAIDYLEAGGTR